ncbi:hypothetical protein [Streptomyces sp. ML-6]|uniref:hypothetical protein n=1 Tax=Streptomyces sp. ML-6 TaxID=2982693 RepID=UPI0024BF943D|nr:hypothetical protein [Streptomyces sp. ML-6]MDK0525027.1 hypothetical protein [Streptomyces sp. ML-6]
MSDATTALQAAEHAGRWKADHGQAPHYTRAVLGEWTCLACPLGDCDWHHDNPAAQPSDPALLEGKVREHLADHDVVDVVRSLQAARDASVAVRESNDRAWDAVNLHRLRAVHRGEHAYSDPVGQMLSAALVGTAEHEDVRREVTELSPAWPAPGTSPPYRRPGEPARSHERGTGDAPVRRAVPLSGPRQPVVLLARGCPARLPGPQLPPRPRHLRRGAGGGRPRNGPTSSPGPARKGPGASALTLTGAVCRPTHR